MQQHSDGEEWGNTRVAIARNGCIYTNLTFWLQLENNLSVDLVGDSQLELPTRSQLWSQTRRIGLELSRELGRSWSRVGLELPAVKPPNGSSCIFSFN